LFFFCICFLKLNISIMSNSLKASEAIRLNNAKKYFSEYNTHLHAYKMNKETFNKRIKQNLEMNKNLIYTPAEERYWLRLRTANQDLSTAYNGHRIRDFDATFAPKKYKAYRNNLPGFYGAPYDYVKYLPESGFNSDEKSRRSSNSQGKKTLNSDRETLNVKNQNTKNSRCFSSIASSEVPHIPSSSSSSSSADSRSIKSAAKSKTVEHVVTADVEEITKETKYFETYEDNTDSERQTGRHTGKVLDSTETGNRSTYDN